MKNLFIRLVVIGRVLMISLDLFFKCSTVYVYSIMDQLTCKGLQKLKFWNSNVLV